MTLTMMFCIVVDFKVDHCNHKTCNDKEIPKECSYVIKRRFLQDGIYSNSLSDIMIYKLLKRLFWIM